MNVQLDVQLRKVAEKTKETQTPLSEVKFLLEGDQQKDLELMRYLASNSQLIENEKELGKVIDLENMNDKFGETFTLEQISVLAVKYQLRFLQSEYYIGKMGIRTINKLKQFAEDYKVPCLDQYTLGTRFFILAPQESFKMDVRYLTTIREEEKEKRRIEKDPLLFYKIDNNHYRLVDKWGTDFSMMRLLKGFYWKSFDNYYKVHRFIATLLFLVLAKASSAWVGTFVWHFGKEAYETCTCKTSQEAAIYHGEFFLTLLIAMSIGLSILYYYIMKGRVTNHDWDARPELFSKTNWSSRSQVII